MAYSPWAYGGTSTMFDLLSGKALAELAFASSFEGGADGRRLAVAIRKGRLMLDVAASRKQGTLVPL